MHTKNIIKGGKNIKEADKVLIMIHGRGGSGEDILSLSNYLDVKDFALLAPQATNHTWYPFSFMAPTAQNEPWLSSALSLVNELVADLEADGFTSGQIYFAGFSQGACLTLEYVTRHARRWGGVVAFTGGLIGDSVEPEKYKGDFSGTPVFIGTSDPDPHVPVERVHASSKILRNMNADVLEKVYSNMGHTISADEIYQANRIVFTKTVVNS